MIFDVSIVTRRGMRYNRHIPRHSRDLEGEGAMLREHHRFFLPTMLFFTNGNGFLGSFLGLRFQITVPEKDGEMRFSCLTWYGERCLEESEPVATAEFPLTEDGREQVIDWLEAEYLRMPEVGEGD